ncbi:receptor-type adenylate cyclase, putative, partial [Bodo saltans]
MQTSFLWTIGVAAIVMTFSVSGELIRPNLIKLGMYYNMADTIMQFDGTQMYAGAKAAEKEINAGGTIDGVQLEVVYVPAASYTSPASVVAAAASSFVNDTQYFGAILTDWVTTPTLLSTVAVGTGLNGTYPVIGARHRVDVVTGTRSDISVRQPAPTDYLMMLHHAMNAATIRCTSFAVVTRGGFMAAPIEATIASLGLHVLILELGADYSTTPAVATVLDQWSTGNANTHFYPPQCGLFFSIASDTHAILEGMYADARFNMSLMAFYSSGIASEGYWNSTLYGVAPFANFRVVTNLLSPNSATSPLAISFRAALSSYFADLNASDVPADMQQVPTLTTISLPSFEGYVTVRWIAEILSAMPSINRTLFLRSVYSRRFFWVGDTSLGPMTDRCLVDSTSSLPCACSFGLNMMRTAKINVASALPALDDVDASISTLLVPLDACYLTSSDLRTPVAVAVWYPASSSATSITVFKNFQRMMSALGTTYNNALTTARVMFSAALMNPIMPLLANESSASYLQRVYVQRMPAVTFGDIWSEVTKPVINIIASGSTLYQDPPLTAATMYSRNSWMLKPTLGDLAHGIVLGLEELYTNGGRAERTPTIVVVSDTEAGLSLATQSVHTVQWPVSGGGVLNLADAAVMRTAVRGAMSKAASGEETLLFVSSVSAAVTVNAIAAAVAASQAYEGHSSGPSVWAHFVLAIATDQNNMYTAKFGLTNRSALPHFPIYFGSYLPAFWEPTNARRLRVISTLNTTDPTVIETTSMYSSQLIFSLLQTAVEAATATRPTATDLLDVLYESSTLTANGVVIGPIYDTNCSAAVVASNTVNRRCQCFKILRTINAFDFRDWLMNTASHNPDFQWSMPTCGVEYSPLIVPTKLNVALIAGLAAPLGTVALGALVYFACCFGRRSNRTAPKSPESPFAMVFTDIQSSTSLWARAPEAMGEALEQHHALLRKLVSRHDGYEVKT